MPGKLHGRPSVTSVGPMPTGGPIDASLRTTGRVICVSASAVKRLPRKKRSETPAEAKAAALAAGTRTDAFRASHPKATTSTDAATSAPLGPSKRSSIFVTENQPDAAAVPQHATGRHHFSMHVDPFDGTRELKVHTGRKRLSSPRHKPPVLGVRIHSATRQRDKSPYAVDPTPRRPQTLTNIDTNLAGSTSARDPPMSPSKRVFPHKKLSTVFGPPIQAPMSARSFMTRYKSAPENNTSSPHHPRPVWTELHDGSPQRDPPASAGGKRQITSHAKEASLVGVFKAVPLRNIQYAVKPPFHTDTPRVASSTSPARPPNSSRIASARVLSVGADSVPASRNTSEPNPVLAGSQSLGTPHAVAPTPLSSARVIYSQRSSQVPYGTVTPRTLQAPHPANRRLAIARPAHMLAITDKV